MYFTETQIQTQNWRDLAAGLSFSDVSQVGQDYIESEVEGFQFVPQNGLVLKLAKYKDGRYFFLGPGIVPDLKKETVFRFYKLNKWGF